MDEVEEIIEEQVPENVEQVEEIDEVEEQTPVNTQAQALWDLLNSPATAKSTLNTIARNLGMTVSETKTEEGQKAIKDVIKLALGDDLAFLGDKLGPLGDAIESLINDRISKAEVKITERQREQEANRYAAIVDTTIRELDVETKGEFSNLLPKINKLMEDMPIGRQSPDQYLRRLYGIVKSEAGAPVRTTETKVEKARRESAQSQVRSQNNPERTKDGATRNPTYKEAILQAMRADARK